VKSFIRLTSYQLALTMYKYIWTVLYVAFKASRARNYNTKCMDKQFQSAFTFTNNKILNTWKLKRKTERKPKVDNREALPSHRINTEYYSNFLACISCYYLKGCVKSNTRWLLENFEVHVTSVEIPSSHCYSLLWISL